MMTAAIDPGTSTDASTGASLVEQYAAVTGPEVVRHLRQLAEPLEGAKVVHVNSTREGGGVAEILRKLVPLSRELGIEASWETITGTEPFFQCTKWMHNALQGYRVEIPDSLLRTYEEVNTRNAEELADRLRDADFVFIHDPQPAALLRNVPDRRGRWVWRCHIDASHPQRRVWRYLRQYVGEYDVSIFSLAAFAQSLPIPQYIVPPSIDPLSEKNRDLPPEEIDDVRRRFGLDPDAPMVLQVSRFDRFKDPLGVIEAHRLARRFVPELQLVLVGSGASDDPEGEEVLREVEAATEGRDEIRVLLLPPDAHRTINALQRAADVVIQKSLREGFGLTVTEALWKGKPVIGGDAGGIRLQVVNHHTGFLVSTPEGAALRMRYLLHHPGKAAAMGRTGSEFVREHFLLTRQLREYLTLMVALLHGAEDRIEL